MTLNNLSPPTDRLLTGDITVTLQINNQAYTVQIEPRVTLLDLLRERLGLTSSKKGCDHRQYGACTVLIDGRRIAIHAV